MGWVVLSGHQGKLSCPVLGSGRAGTPTGPDMAPRWCIMERQSNPISQRNLSLSFLCLEKAVEQSVPHVLKLHGYHTANTPAWGGIDTHSTKREDKSDSPRQRQDSLRDTSYRRDRPSPSVLVPASVQLLHHLAAPKATSFWPNERLIVWSRTLLGPPSLIASGREERSKWVVDCCLSLKAQLEFFQPQRHVLLVSYDYFQSGPLKTCMRRSTL